MEKVVDGLLPRGHAEFALEDAPEVGAAKGEDAVLGRGPGLRPLSEAGQLRPGQARRAAGVGPLVPSLGPAGVVTGDPALDRAYAAAEGRGDPGGGSAPGGDEESLEAEPDPVLDDGPGPSLQLLEGEMVVDKHERGSGGRRWPPHLARNARPAEHLCR